MSSAIKASDLVAFEHAAAGHDGVLSDAKGELVIKPCTAAEVAFYETAQASHPAFAKYMPMYMGTLALSDTLPEPSATPIAAQTAAKLDLNDVGPAHGAKLTTGTSIVLSNATAGFKKPNVLDLKLGARLWEEGTPPEKRARLDKVSSETTSSSLGFRIAGMTVYQGDGSGGEGLSAGGFKDYGKLYGRQFNAANVGTAFKEYFITEKAGVTEDLAKVVVARFEKDVAGILKMLEAEESRMYGASILMVYEGNGAVLEEALEEEKVKGPISAMISEDDDDEGPPRKKVHETVLIDFAHANWTPGLGPDENALQGVRSAVQILRDLF